MVDIDNTIIQDCIYQQAKIASQSCGRAESQPSIQGYLLLKEIYRA